MYAADKIRIKLKSFDLLDLNETCEAIKNIASETGAKLSGPVPLPLKKKVSEKEVKRGRQRERERERERDMETKRERERES